MNKLTGKELKLERIKKDIKAIDVAEHLGYTNAYISMMESGKSKIPNHVYVKWVRFLEENKK